MLPKMQYSLRCLLFLYLSGVQDISQPYKASDIDVSAWSVYIQLIRSDVIFFFLQKPRLAQCTRWTCLANEADVQFLFLCSLFAVRPHVSQSAYHLTFVVNQTRLLHNSPGWTLQLRLTPCSTYICDHVIRNRVIRKTLTLSFPNFIFQPQLSFPRTFLLRIPRDAKLFNNNPLNNPITPCNSLLSSNTVL